MDEQALTRCAPDDPRRCQASHASMQCPYLADYNSIYCSRHGSASVSRERREGLRNYNLTKYKAKVEQKLSSPRLKLLTEEIGILRLVLENLLEQVSDDYELTLYSTKITELVAAIRATIESSTKLEEKANLTLDKSQVLIIGQRLISIISEHLPEDRITEVAEKISQAFEVDNG